jgi:PAS domain S-box-containing protein
MTETEMKRIETISGQPVNCIKRKQGEETLKASEQKFRSSLDNSSLGIRITDKEGDILYANQTMLDLFEFKNLEELKAVPLQDLYTTESRAAWNERHEQFLRGELAPDKVQFDIKLKNGTIRSLETSHKEVLWDGQMAYQTIYDDITDLKQKGKKQIKE